MHRRKITLAVVLLLMALISASAAPRGPVIGVITQPASDAGSIGGNHTQYLNSGYVKVCTRKIAGYFGLKYEFLCGISTA